MVSVLEPQKKMGACDPKSRIFWDIFLKSRLENPPFTGTCHYDLGWGWEVNEVNEDLKKTDLVITVTVCELENGLFLSICS